MTLTTLQETFVRRMPTLKKMARIGFRNLGGELREECVTNAVALAWKGFYSLFRKGRAGEPGILDSVMRFSIRQARSRLPQGCPRKRDMLAPRWVGPTRMADFEPEQFVSRSTSIPDAVIFRVDVAEGFFSTLSDRQRKMAVDLASGMSTTEAATKYDLSPGRISQFRREFKELFEAFFAD